MRHAVFLSLLAVVGCDHVDRGWRGNMTGDYRQVSACASDRLSVSQTLREDTQVAIITSGPRTAPNPFEARLQQTAPDRFFAEMRHGSHHPAGLAAWQVIQACAEGGPDRIQQPGQVRAAL